MTGEHDAASEELLVEHQPEGIVLLGLNRIKARNALSFSIWKQLGQALDQIEQSGSPPLAVILYGAGEFFSAGGDIKIPPARGEGALRTVTRLEMAQRIIARLRALPSPTIAAVEGAAIGLGWSLALACDMVFASSSAHFSAPFVKLGLVPDGGIGWFLTQRLGRQRASEIIYSAREIGAEDALALGLASRVTSPGQAMAQAIEFAAGLNAAGRHTIELTKRLLHQAECLDLQSYQALELVLCHETQVNRAPRS